MLMVAACTDKDPEPVVYELTGDELHDPENCIECHPAHVEEWSGSMHAYATEDPVFQAMNARGQRETNGELGDFCVNCHAPMAVREGYTQDGTNLDEIPSHLRGVGCGFCHLVDGVDDDHNAELSLATDEVMRGPYTDPTENTAHASAWSPLQDRTQLESADACGTCHDIITPAGVHLERTYLEWRDSQYSVPEAGLQQTCGNCHMDGRDDVAAEYDGVPLRRVHGHAMPGVDVALTPWPQADEQLAAVQSALDSTVLVQLEVYDAGVGMGVIVFLDNVSAGHGFPSGAAHDRRAWLELVGYDEAGEVIWSSGLVGEDEKLRDYVAEDPQLWWFGDRTYDSAGEEAHMFWEVASVESQPLPAPSRYDPGTEGWVDSHQSRTFTMTGAFPARISARIRIRPVGLDVLEDLVESGDLDPSVVESMPTFTLAASETEWVADSDE